MQLSGPPSTLTALAVLGLVLLTTPRLGRAGTYEEATSLMDQLLTKSGYKPQVRPLVNQSDTLDVYLIFELLSVVEVSDVTQSFLCNGFMGIFWYDQILQWNISDHGDVPLITPDSKDVFRPRIALLNTMGDRDLFLEDNAPVVVHFFGLVTWLPGSIFHSSCQLDLTKYPFDEQTCKLDMIAMDFPPDMLRFVALEDEVLTDFYIKNGEWELKYSNLTAETIIVNNSPMSSIVVSLTMRRKPEFLLISVLLPIVFLSLLNLLVFVIPVESGEKISFGITVLLALSVFLSIIAQMLPRSSESMPLMIRYIFCLLIISLLTVVDSIIIVRLHHMDEKEVEPPPQQKPRPFPSVLPKVMTLTGQQTASPLNHLRFIDADVIPSSRSTSTKTEKKAKARANRFKSMGKHVDLFSLVLFGLVWLALTIEFLVSATAS